MSKLSYKANARTKIDENLVFLPIISSLFTLSLVILLTGVVWADQKITKSHGFNFFGELSYQEDFAHLKYVNKDAPKGGDISIWSMGTFDSMNPYTRKGRSGALASAPFESLLDGTADDVKYTFQLFLEQGLASYKAILGQIIKDTQVLGPKKIKYWFNPDASKRDAIPIVGGLPVMSKAWFDTTVLG